ncbi:hypothetical protein DFH09DRAFT_1307307 [Mycena vulgaris]|nr:hypothetical protein DFH09DRAFT_1307307 [Mycena vulgaris]
MFGVPSMARKEANILINHILTFPSSAATSEPEVPLRPPQTTLVDIGLRFVLMPIHMFEGAVGGATGSRGKEMRKATTSCS